MTNAQLRDVLTDELHLKDAIFKLERHGSRVSGSVVSTSFEGKGDAERQRAIWDALDKRLGAESTLQVGMLLAFTPAEWGLRLEGHRNGRGKTKHSSN